MKIRKLILTITLLGGLLMSENVKAESLKMTLEDGVVIIKLLPEVAPNHVAQIKKLTKEGFYDGIVFHRVIDGFMAQTGDPTGTGMGGSEEPNIKAEFNHTKFNRGTVGMARSQDPDSANSQFFICFKPSYFLNGQYTVWGEVTEGMDHIDNLKKGEPPVDPDKIIKMEIID